MRIRTVVITAAAIAALTVVLWILLPHDGFSARAEPSAVERVLARAARRLAVPRLQRDARNPITFSPDVWIEARTHFADHCASCHGNDGRGNTEIGRSLYPKAPDMRLPDTQRLTDGELYWIIANGVRLTGMPAWGDGSANDAGTWGLVHFIRRLADLSEEDVQAMEQVNPRSRLEFEEELQDRQFLEGKDVDTPPAIPHHQHKEQP